MDMTTTETKTISVPIRATILRGESAGLGSLRCLNCQGPLDLSQPDTDSPGRLVGVCPGCRKQCGSCHVINAEDESETLVIMIPSFAVLREAIEFDPEAI